MKPRPRPVELTADPPKIATASPCQRCGHERTVERRCAGGPHFSVKRCEKCGTLRGWGSHPKTAETPAPPELLERARLRTHGFAPLKGSPKQIDWAESIRARMHGTATAKGDTDTARVLACVEDSTYFVAHARKAYDEMHWPAPGQLETGG